MSATTTVQTAKNWENVIDLSLTFKVKQIMVACGH